MPASAGMPAPRQHHDHNELSCRDSAAYPLASELRGVPVRWHQSQSRGATDQHGGTTANAVPRMRQALRVRGRHGQRTAPGCDRGQLRVISRNWRPGEGGHGQGRRVGGGGRTASPRSRSPAAAVRLPGHRAGLRRRDRDRPGAATPPVTCGSFRAGCAWRPTAPPPARGTRGAPGRSACPAASITSYSGYADRSFGRPHSVVRLALAVHRERYRRHAALPVVRGEFDNYRANIAQIPRW